MFIDVHVCVEHARETHRLALRGPEYSMFRRRSSDEWLNRAEDWRLLAIRERSPSIRHLFFLLAEDYEGLTYHAALREAAEPQPSHPTLLLQDAL